MIQSPGDATIVPSRVLISMTGIWSPLSVLCAAAAAVKSVKSNTSATLSLPRNWTASTTTGFLRNLAISRFPFRRTPNDFNAVALIRRQIGLRGLSLRLSGFRIVDVRRSAGVRVGYFHVSFSPDVEFAIIPSDYPIPDVPLYLISIGRDDANGHRIDLEDTFPMGLNCPFRDIREILM